MVSVEGKGTGSNQQTRSYNLIDFRELSDFIPAIAPALSKSPGPIVSRPSAASEKVVVRVRRASLSAGVAKWWGKLAVDIFPERYLLSGDSGPSYVLSHEGDIHASP